MLCLSLHFPSKLSMSGSHFWHDFPGIHGAYLLQECYCQNPKSQALEEAWFEFWKIEFKASEGNGEAYSFLFISTFMAFQWKYTHLPFSRYKRTTQRGAELILQHKEINVLHSRRAKAVQHPPCKIQLH